MEVEAPHFSYPFRLAAGPGTALNAAVTEQDSLDEIADCVVRITNTERGDRDDLPEFGVTYPLFDQAPVNAARLVDELKEWEPRADLSGTARIDSLDELVSVIRLDVRLEDRGEQ